MLSAEISAEKVSNHSNRSQVDVNKVIKDRY